MSAPVQFEVPFDLFARYFKFTVTFSLKRFLMFKLEKYYEIPLSCINERFFKIYKNDSLVNFIYYTL